MATHRDISPARQKPACMSTSLPESSANLLVPHLPIGIGWRFWQQSSTRTAWHTFHDNLPGSSKVTQSEKQLVSTPWAQKKRENNAQDPVIHFHNRQKIPVGCHKALNKHAHFWISSWGTSAMEQIKWRQLLLPTQFLSWTSFPVPKSELTNC